MTEITLTIEELSKLAPPPNYNHGYGWLPHTSLNNRDLMVVAEVNDSVTGNIISTNATTPVKNQKYQVKFMDITPTTFKPGLMYTGYVSVGGLKTQGRGGYNMLITKLCN